jgi:hypothetical protein
VLGNGLGRQLDAGEVEIELNSKSLVLRPTLQACKTISRQRGGFAKVRDLLVSEDFDTVVSVIAVGTNRIGDTTAIENEVWQNGLDTKLLLPLIEYIAILGNGGRPLAGNVKSVFSMNMSDNDFRQIEDQNQGNDGSH